MVVSVPENGPPDDEVVSAERRLAFLKWMRWRTYETKLKVWEEAVEKASTELIARAMMGLKRR